MHGEMPLHYHGAVGLWHEGCVPAPAGPFVEKVTYIGLVLYALRHKENVATEYAHGSFNLVATGNAVSKKLP
jgi:hypothetical protein